MIFQEVIVYIILVVTTFIAIRNVYLSVFGSNRGGCSGCSSAGSCSSFSGKSSLSGGLKLERFKR